MEINKELNEGEMWKNWEKSHRRGRIVGGIAVVGAGALFLAREMGVIIPEWIFTWQMLLIVIGLFIGIKHAFRTIGWIIPVIIGLAFMLRDFAPWMDVTHYFWPIAIIIVGLIIIFKPKRRYCEGRWTKENWRAHYEREMTAQQYSKEDFIDFNSVFGAIKKNIISKNFRGGEVNAVFGGAEINLMQADFTGTIELEINTVFGGARLILPSHWEVKSEIAAVMGSVEDKRPVHKDIVTDSGRVLILRGNAVFGGIEIQSY